MNQKENKPKIHNNIENLLKQEGFFVFNADDPGVVLSHDIITEGDKGLVDEIQSRFYDNKDQVKAAAPAAEEQKVLTVHPSLSRDVYDIPVIISYLKWHTERISRNVVGRGEIINQLVYAILNREHMLLLSRTGMAKSYLAFHVFNTFSDARVFASQASKDQTPDNYFGPYNIEEFKKGRIRHNIHGSIIEANLVLLDEFFDASDVVLRSLLSVLNERKFINGPEQIDVAIHTAIATANYMRFNEVTEAVLDRFMYKAVIPEDTDMYNHLLIDRAYEHTKGKAEEPERPISFNQIKFISEIVRNNSREYKIELPDSISFLKNVLVNKYVSEMRKSDSNFFISPRKQASMANFLRSSAILDNRFKVNTDDLKNMYFGLCTLNSFVSVKQKDHSEKDVFLRIYEQTMSHYTAAKAFDQIDFLVELRSLFQEIRDDPDKREKLNRSAGIIQGMKNLFRKIFPGKDIGEEVSVQSLKKTLLELNPAVEEVRELKQGILRDYKDLT